MDIQNNNTICNKSVTDLTHLSWNFNKQGSGSGGMFLKANEKENNVLMYYKLSAFNEQDGIYGHECVNEIICSRLCEYLGFNHLHYDLIHAKINVSEKEYVTWLVKSADYKKPEEKRITMETLCKQNRVNISNRRAVYEFIKTLPFAKDVFQMMFLDYIVYNRDRHGANIEVLYNKKDQSYRLAPIFDCGSSLFAPLQKDTDQISNYNLLSNKPVNNFIYSMFLDDYLDILPDVMDFPQMQVEALFLDDLAEAFDENGQLYVEKIKEMLKTRYENIHEKFAERGCERA